MGEVLDYERGKLCIGRLVKCNAKSGHGPGNGGCVGVLKGATRAAAIVQPKGHKRTENIPWNEVEDWVAGNNGPAPKPATYTIAPSIASPIEGHDREALTEALRPKPAAEPEAPARPPEPPKRKPRRMEKTWSPPPDIPDDPPARLVQTFADRISAGAADLATARDLVREARAMESAALRTLIEIRDELVELQRKVQDAIAGTANGGEGAEP